MDLRAQYGLTFTPFTREIPVEHFFPLPQFEEARDGLLGVARRRMSGALIAPAGFGKTSLEPLERTPFSQKAPQHVVVFKM